MKSDDPRCIFGRQYQHQSPPYTSECEVSVSAPPPDVVTPPDSNESCESGSVPVSIPLPVPVDEIKPEAIEIHSNPPPTGSEGPNSVEVIRVRENEEVPIPNGNGTLLQHAHSHPDDEDRNQRRAEENQGAAVNAFDYDWNQNLQFMRNLNQPLEEMVNSPDDAIDVDPIINGMFPNGMQENAVVAGPGPSSGSMAANGTPVYENGAGNWEAHYGNPANQNWSYNQATSVPHTSSWEPPRRQIYEEYQYGRYGSRVAGPSSAFFPTDVVDLSRNPGYANTAGQPGELEYPDAGGRSLVDSTSNPLDLTTTQQGSHQQPWNGSYEPFVFPNLPCSNETEVVASPTNFAGQDEGHTSSQGGNATEPVPLQTFVPEIPDASIEQGVPVAGPSSAQTISTGPAPNPTEIVPESGQEESLLAGASSNIPHATVTTRNQTQETEQVSSALIANNGLSLPPPSEDSSSDSDSDIVYLLYVPNRNYKQKTITDFYSKARKLLAKSRRRFTTPAPAVSNFTGPSGSQGNNFNRRSGLRNRRSTQTATQQECPTLGRHGIDEARASTKTCLCGKTFVSKSGLKHHVHWFSPQDWKFKCAECDQPFFSHNLMRQHLTKEHGKPDQFGKNAYHCSKCDQMFKSKSQFWKHHNAVHRPGRARVQA